MTVKKISGKLVPTCMSGGGGGVEDLGLPSLESFLVVNERGTAGLGGWPSVISSSSISDPVLENSSDV